MGSKEMLCDLAMIVEQVNQNYIFEAQTYFFMRPSPDCIYLDFNRKGRLYLFSRITVGKDGSKCRIEKFDYSQNEFRNFETKFKDTPVKMIGDMMKKSLSELITL